MEKLVWVNPLTRSVEAPNVHGTDRPVGRFDRLGRLRCQERQRVRVCFCVLSGDVWSLSGTAKSPISPAAASDSG